MQRPRGLKRLRSRWFRWWLGVCFVALACGLIALARSLVVASRRGGRVIAAVPSTTPGVTPSPNSDTPVQSPPRPQAHPDQFLHKQWAQMLSSRIMARHGERGGVDVMRRPRSIRKMPQGWDVAGAKVRAELSNATSSVDESEVEVVLPADVPPIHGVVPASMRDADAVNRAGGTESMMSRRQDSAAGYRYSPRQLTDLAASMDIVYTWVNGSHHVHRHRRAELRGFHSAAAAAADPVRSVSRDRDSGELKASLRSLHKHLSWHRARIIIVTPGHVPEWLTLADDQISVVHQDALTDDDVDRYTANTNTIEPFLHRIPGLTEQFVQINDDCFFTRDVGGGHFLDAQGGGPVLALEANPIGGALSPQAARHPRGNVWLASVYATHTALQASLGSAPRYFLKHAPFVFCRTVAHGVFEHFRAHLREHAMGCPTRCGRDFLFPFLHHYVALEAPDMAYEAIRQARGQPAGSTSSLKKVRSRGNTAKRLQLAECPPAVGRVGLRANASLLVLQDGVNWAETEARIRAEATVVATMTVNDGLRNSTDIAGQFSDFLAKWYPHPSPWEQPSVHGDGGTVGGLSTMQTPLSVVMAVRSCAAACAAVRSASTLGFPHAASDRRTRFQVLLLGSEIVEPSCRSCPGGRRRDGFNVTYTVSEDRVGYHPVPSHHGVDERNFAAKVCASSGVCDTPGSTVPLVIVVTPDPIFGEAVCTRHLHQARGVRGYTVGLTPRPMVVGAPWSSKLVLQLGEEIPQRSYLLSYPVPSPIDAFEREVTR